jgi:hypothetical protein
MFRQKTTHRQAGAGDLSSVADGEATLTPSIIRSFTQLYGFFTGGESLEEANRFATVAHLRIFADGLVANWRVMTPEAREQAAQLPEMWDLVVEQWNGLSAEEREAIHRSWMPNLPVPFVVRD